MKKAHLSILTATLLLIGINFVSACTITESNTAAITLPSTAKINIEVLENYCTDENCEIYSQDNHQKVGKYITFQTEEGQKVIFIAKSYLDVEKNTEKNILSIQFQDKDADVKKFTSLGLRLLIANNIIEGITSKDVSDISKVIDLGGIVYFMPSNCENEEELGWLLGASNLEVEYVDGECTELLYLKCGALTAPSTLTLTSLSLIEPPITEYIESSTTENSEESNSNYLYWLIGIILVIIIAIIFIRKK